MTARNSHPHPARPAGYDALIGRFGLQVLGHWHHSAIAGSAAHQSRAEAGQVFDTYPRIMAPDDSFAGHLEFALKHDGVNLEILAALFAKVNPKELLKYVRSKPTGRYARRAWYLYELLTQRRLPLTGLTSGNYVDLLAPDLYYTSAPIRVRRQRINDNLLGDARFCPILRRTALLEDFAEKDLPRRCQQVLAAYPRDIFRRAMNYLYTKETRSSFEIENVPIDASRSQRFVALLVEAHQKDFYNKQDLIGLQNRIVDQRFRDHDYRQTQNYVGESVNWTQQRVHYVAPKPADLPELMEGTYAAHRRMNDPRVHPVLHAAAVAFGFVFLHPFEDGNGRIHRFLIHNVLARRGFTPPAMIFPVSAVMLQDREAYDAALEAFSHRLLPLIDYALDDQGRMTVRHDTALHYRYLDLTPQAEALFAFIQRVIEVELVEELQFLRSYDAAKKAIQAIVDMPDRLIDLFIRLCLQNKGMLSQGKRASVFTRLTDEEVARMTAAVRQAYPPDAQT